MNIDRDEDLDLVMSMYNVIEYSSNYFETKIKMKQLILMLIPANIRLDEDVLKMS